MRCSICIWEYSEITKKEGRRKIVRRSSFVVRRSVVRRSSFVVRRSSFVVRRSSFVVRLSYVRWVVVQFVVRRSSFVVRTFVGRCAVRRSSFVVALFVRSSLLCSFVRRCFVRTFVVRRRTVVLFGWLCFHTQQGGHRRRAPSVGRMNEWL